MRLWHADGAKEIHQATPITLEAIVRAIAFSPDGTKLLAGCNDNSARLFDSRTGTLLAKLPHGGIVRAVAFRGDGAVMLTAAEDGVVQLWDVAGQIPAGSPRRFSSGVSAASFVPGQSACAVGCTDGRLSLVPMKTPVLPTSDLDELKLWLEVTTGLTEDDRGGVRALSQSDWQERVDRWNGILDSRSDTPTTRRPSS